MVTHPVCTGRKLHWRGGTHPGILRLSGQLKDADRCGGLSLDARCAFTSQAFQQGVSESGYSAAPPGHRQPDGDSRWRAVVRVLRSQRLLQRLLRSTTDALASAVFPTDCCLCHLPLACLTRVPVCSDCWSDLPAQSGMICLICGEALGAHAFASEDRAPGDWLCRPCRAVPPDFDRAVAHGLYRGTLRSLLHLLKYDGMEPSAAPLGRLMAAQIAALPGVPAQMTVIPVPLFAGKRRQRGFNQAELLARVVAHAGRAHGLDLQVDTRILTRTRDTASQAGLTPIGRRRNVRGAFAVRGHAAGTQPLAGRNLLLIDDIYTTGATARAASSALRRAGAEQIWVATAARAQRQELAEPVQAIAIQMEEDVAFWN
jgi:ComF family protein